jgi:ADP-heptose:LPS heptosyltransferase
VVGEGEPLPPFDVHCPLMSLPLAFKTTLDNVPAPAAYLGAPAAKVQEVQQKLGPRTKPRVGLIWSGNIAHRNDAQRSIALATLLAALPQDVQAGVQFVCLQKDIREADAATLKAHPEVVYLPEVMQAFEGTAALADQMDLVISVDTSVAHLAGALGKPTWVLLTKVSDWRWLTGRTDSPWYPKARLFRQAAWGSWDEALREVAQALSTLVKS